MWKESHSDTHQRNHSSAKLVFGQFTRAVFLNHEALDTPICDRNSVDRGGVVGMFHAGVVRRECGRQLRGLPVDGSRDVLPRPSVPANEFRGERKVLRPMALGFRIRAYSASQGAEGTIEPVCFGALPFGAADPLVARFFSQFCLEGVGL